MYFRLHLAGILSGDALIPAGTGRVSITQNFSTSDTMGRLTLNMLMRFAEYERKMVAGSTRLPSRCGGCRHRRVLACP